MNKKGLSGWTWFWIILFLLIITGGGYSWYSSSGYASYDYDSEEDPYEYCYDVYYDVLCGCGFNQYDCKDFLTQDDAQECYNLCNCLGKGDVHHLDRDNDGIACEWNN